MKKYVYAATILAILAALPLGAQAGHYLPKPLTDAVRNFVAPMASPYADSTQPVIRSPHLTFRMTH